MTPWTRRRLLRALPAAVVPSLLPDSLRAVAQSASPPKPPSAPFSRFVDIGAAAGLSHPTFYGENEKSAYILEVMGAGCAFIDYDNDGWIDIFMLSGRRLEGVPSGASNRLYKNNRDGTFTDVTEKAGLSDAGWAMGVCVGDYDNDGFDDLFVTYYGQNRLYHNNGNGTFTDVTEKAGLLQPGIHYASAAPSSSAIAMASSTSSSPTISTSTSSTALNLPCRFPTATTRACPSTAVPSACPR